MTRVAPGKLLRESRLWAAYRQNRYRILFYSLLLMLVALPTAATIGLPQWIIKLVLATCVFAAVMPNATRRTRWTILVAIGLLLVARFLGGYGDFRIPPALPVVLVGVVGLAAAAGSLRFAINSDLVDGETIYAVLSTYLLAGVFFGQIYWGIETAAPGSFSGPDPFSEVAAVYYSFVTLATLGYGDYLPRTELTRGIATFEVIGGQLYLAALVARLIGLFQPPEAGA